MALEDEVLYRIIFPVISMALGTLLIYVVRKYNGIVEKVEKHHRTLYGDGEEWIGISNLVRDLKKLEVQDRHAVIALVSLLARNNIIVPDKELDNAFSKIRDDS